MSFKRLIIIGNGLDLHYSLQTSDEKWKTLYSNYKFFLEKNYEIYKEWLLFLKNEIKLKNKVGNWNKIEYFIEKYIRKNQTRLHKYPEENDSQEVNNKIILYEQKQRSLRDFFSLFNSPSYVSHINNLTEDKIKLNKYDFIFNFNYTFGAEGYIFGYNSESNPNMSEISQHEMGSYYNVVSHKTEKWKMWIIHGGVDWSNPTKSFCQMYDIHKKEKIQKNAYKIVEPDLLFGGSNIDETNYKYTRNTKNSYIEWTTCIRNLLTKSINNNIKTHDLYSSSNKQQEDDKDGPFGLIKNVETIYALGCSFGMVDKEYFRKINELLPLAKWHVSIYGKNMLLYLINKFKIKNKLRKIRIPLKNVEFKKIKYLIKEINKFINVE